jgi:Carboxypeptidase regulatory-like domain
MSFCSSLDTREFDRKSKNWVLTSTAFNDIRLKALRLSQGEGTIMQPLQLRSLFRRGLFFSALVCFFTSAPLKAQFTSIIDGKVTDPSDAGVPKAVVTLENQVTGVKRVVETSDDGYYRAASLPPGSFTIRVTAPGFDTGVFENVLLENDSNENVQPPVETGYRVDPGNGHWRGAAC